MKKVVILIQLLLVISCSPTIDRRISKLPTENLPKGCEQLNSTVNNGFFHLKGQNYFIMSGHTRGDVLSMADCITKLSCNKIKLVFGEPSLETETKMYYYLSSTKFSNGVRPDVLTFYKKNVLMIDKVTIESCLEEYQE
ncbi:MAG: hypothetical protein AB8G11_24080 [Saprospiraceae bacterium]